MVKNKKLKFEEAVTRLEEIVQQLEGETVSLEESLKLFEEGMNLTKMCREELTVAESTIKMLSRNSEGELESTEDQS
ncbi:MAG: exodeoxyribonuclease VII small subunit [Candidatus Marinimicrobia bacterium]|jgi:exodeoxyribonuclease VII small subunit|nr:exodeoxyribonuclease VII small subunit [Candidatus Neomarinimicrobiota bacterium]MDP7026410.1 exodeoxyribonuclease VII small subunit [Candidatus Neomarinimicrobiota bacterium]|tara:strand:+ start:597 stop:827 length:231 start_codon:yes stop_codon:yes gene_type:complete